LGANLGLTIVTNGDWGLYGVRVQLPQSSELRFGVVRVVGRGIAVLDGSGTNTRLRTRLGRS